MGVEAQVTSKWGAFGGEKSLIVTFMTRIITSDESHVRIIAQRSEISVNEASIASMAL